MTVEDGAGQLHDFVHRWPVGTHLTTRGIQIGAGIPNLEAAEQAAQRWRAQGYLDVQTIGATHLWHRRDAGTAPPSMIVAG